MENVGYDIHNKLIGATLIRATVNNCLAPEAQEKALTIYIVGLKNRLSVSIVYQSRRRRQVSERTYYASEIFVSYI